MKAWLLAGVLAAAPALAQSVDGDHHHRRQHHQATDATQQQDPAASTDQTPAADPLADSTQQNSVSTATAPTVGSAPWFQQFDSLLAQIEAMLAQWQAAQPAQPAQAAPTVNPGGLPAGVPTQTANQAPAPNPAPATNSAQNIPQIIPTPSDAVTNPPQSSAPAGVAAVPASSNPGSAATSTLSSTSTVEAPLAPDTTVQSFASCANEPAPAVAAGYNLQTLGGPINVGSTWLPDTIHGGGSPNVTSNSDGSVTIAGGGDAWNGQLATAMPTWPGYTGEVFGGGFYAQATVTVQGNTAGLSPWTGGNSGDQWPSFWANSSNNATDTNTIETDFMELEDGTPGQYNGTVINWTTNPQTGIGQTFTAPNGNNLQTATYGFLWIPATSTSQGSMTFYLNGQQVGQPITWTKDNPGLYGAIDGQQMTLFLGAGANSPATFSDVEVWQASTADDAINGSPLPPLTGSSAAQACNLPASNAAAESAALTGITNLSAALKMGGNSP